MNGERFAGTCREFAGRMNETWGGLTGDPLRVDAGRRAQIVGRTQRRNGIAKEDSARQLKDFLHRNRNR